MENARLLMRAQTDLNLLAGQMTAGEERTKRQIEWHQTQQQQEKQRAQGHDYVHQGQQRQWQEQGCQEWPQSRQHAHYQETQMPTYRSRRGEQDDNRSDCVIA